MGQDNTTALAQMLAEELEVPFAAVDMVMGDTRLCPWTGHQRSRSIKYFGPALRVAGAEAREVLIQLGAEQLKLPAARLAAQGGFVVDRDNPRFGSPTARWRRPANRAASRHEACPERARGLHRHGQAILPETGWKKSPGRRDSPRHPAAGMLYGRVLRPPAHGARLASADLPRPGGTRARGSFRRPTSSPSCIRPPMAPRRRWRSSRPTSRFHPAQ